MNLLHRILTPFRILVAATLTVLFGIMTIVFRPVDPHGKIFQAFGKAWAKLILLTCAIRVRVSGLDHIGLGKRFIYVSNHASLFDIPAVMAAIPDQIRIVYKKELEKIPIFGWVMKTGPYITIDRDRSFKAMKSLEEAARKIQRGASVLLFAEGTRSKDGRLQPFKRGAFSLAAKTGVPIVPLTINGSYERRPKGKFLIKPGIIDLVLDAPISTDSGEGKEFEMSLMSKVEQVIKTHFREPASTAPVV